MDWVTHFLDNAGWLSDALGIVRQRPGAVLGLAAMSFLVLRGNYRVMLILAFGAALCWANYYIFSQQLFLAMPLAYGVSFAAISAVTLVLLVYQLIHAA